MAVPVSYDRTKVINEFDKSNMGMKGLLETRINSIPQFFVHSQPSLTSGLRPHPPFVPYSSSTSRASTPFPTGQTSSSRFKKPPRPKASSRGFHEQPHEAKAKYYRREEHRGVMFESNNDLYHTEAVRWHDSLQVWMGPQALGAIVDIRGVPKTDVIAWDGHACAKEVLNKHEDGWIDVDPVPGGLIINVREFLQIVSNGEYKSVQHQVLANNMKKTRISIVVFFNLAKWKESDGYQPLPKQVSLDRPAIYRDFTNHQARVSGEGALGSNSY
ncbi:hypothetical protein CRG98_032591 [Punica granatum]|uniref:Isopenicillin N synthase-like Fe(2+) 2OG dioxygenase domain-containing protein n=1 Tax=Punica granatum TaxID=22663 RepID=A0A2I0ISS6_PUNGR|nr:hypothetical protein CRG98_032591 [Punica granatum]